MGQLGPYGTQLLFPDPPDFIVRFLDTVEIGDLPDGRLPIVALEAAGISVTRRRVGIYAQPQIEMLLHDQVNGFLFKELVRQSLRVVVIFEDIALRGLPSLFGHVVKDIDLLVGIEAHAPRCGCPPVGVATKRNAIFNSSIYLYRAQVAVEHHISGPCGQSGLGTGSMGYRRQSCR